MIVASIVCHYKKIDFTTFCTEPFFFKTVSDPSKTTSDFFVHFMQYKQNFYQIL